MTLENSYDYHDVVFAPIEDNVLTACQAAAR